MNKGGNNYAFIDSQNLYLGIKELGWKLDYRKFRVYLWEKYKVTKAFLFLGYIAENTEMYKNLRRDGFILIFKQVSRDTYGGIKGNVDAELVLQTMHELQHFSSAIIVSGDGDFRCLVKYLFVREKLLSLMIPNVFSCSFLLHHGVPWEQQIIFLDFLKEKLQYINHPN